MIKICEYCGDTFQRTASNQKYCPGKKCSSKMNAIKKRLKQKETSNTLLPRKCKRCGEPFHFYGMKRYCQECVKYLKVDTNRYKEIK